MRQYIAIILLGLIFSACLQQQPATKNQGTISYAIAYPEDVQNKGYASFLPNKMVTTFKNNNYKVSIKGELSLYSLDYISRADGDSTTTLFRVFDKRMFHHHEIGEHLFLFEKHGDTTVEFIKSQSKEIAGIQCQKAVVHFKDSDIPHITVYYSEDIKFNRPKENSPFDDIPGALLEFRLPYKGLDLTFTAKKVELKKINDKAFMTPENYTPSDRGEIAELVSALIQ